MARIEDYGMVGDLQTAALISSDGSIDWLCFPHFDSEACFAALLGTVENGRWRLAPRGDCWSGGRRYREDTLILEADWENVTGAVRVIDYLPTSRPAAKLIWLRV